MADDDHAPPSPGELVRTFRTLKRLTSALYHDGELGPIWEALVEGRRNVAVAASLLGRDRPEYQAAWDRMMDFDNG